MPSRAWRAVPVLVAMAACSPIREYEAAARSLRFRLARVEPQLRMALPLDRSRIAFKVVLEVENPSPVPFHVLGFAGDLALTFRDARRPLGRLELARPLDLPAGGMARMETELSFTYQELRENWTAIQAVASGAPGAWHLEGRLKAEAFGLPIQLPVRTTREFGGKG
ncbi:MAG TPA: LEA type 2 family protein [Holophaga sp.]|nr:LEA type 2 family protein [Holophaga sp.]